MILPNAKNPLIHGQACPPMSDDSGLKILHQSDHHYRRLIEQIPAITYIAAMDDFSSTIYTSPQIETLLDFSQDEWMANPTLWLKQIHPDDQEYVLKEWNRVRGGNDPTPCEYRMLTRNGREVWFRDDSAIERDSTGRPIWLYGVMLDITDRKRLENELFTTRRRLAETLKLKLSEREITILWLVKAGQTNNQIGRELSISERTIRYCLEGLRRKFGVTTRLDLIREVIQLGLLEGIRHR